MADLCKARGEVMDSPNDIPVHGLALHAPRPASTNYKCPKCGSKTFTLSEHWNCSIDFSVVGGWIDRANGNLHPDGDPYKVSGLCECGHSWTVRRARQITDVCEEE